MTHCLALFHTTTAALRSEKVARKAGLEARLIPTPRELSSDCGIALRFFSKDQEAAALALAAAGIEFEIHSLP